MKAPCVSDGVPLWHFGFVFSNTNSCCLRITADPVLGLLRIGCMLNVVESIKGQDLGHATALARNEILRKHIERMEPEDNAQTALAPPTEWLIAVRDRRDRQAFGRLFDHFAPRLTAMLLRNGMSRAVADDLVQDVLLTAWQKADQFDPSRAGASAWIYRIARNRQIDHLRRERRPVPDAVVMEAESVEEDAAQAFALDQEARQLRAALDRLTPEQRAVIEQSFLGDLTHTEIRQRTGLPLGTIKSRIRLGLERLRQELKDLR